MTLLLLILAACAPEYNHPVTWGCTVHHLGYVQDHRQICAGSQEAAEEEAYWSWCTYADGNDVRELNDCAASCQLKDDTPCIALEDTGS